MRKWFIAVTAALVLAGFASPASAGPAVTMEATITHGNGTTAVEHVDPMLEGTWKFVANVSGQVDEVLVQLWDIDHRRACGRIIAEKALSGSAAKPYHRRHVEPRQYEFELDSPNLDTTHCVKVVLWGSVGAHVDVEVYPPAGEESLLDSLL